MKHLREVKMTNDNNQLLDKVSFIDKSFEKKLSKTLRKLMIN